MAARVLVIDDQKVLAQLLADALRDDGYEADVAFDGRSGIQMFKQNVYQLVVTDLIMPEFDGLETIRGLRKAGLASKVVAISGGGFLRPEILLSLACKLGADAALVKPFPPTQLLTLVHGLLDDGLPHC